MSDARLSEANTLALAAVVVAVLALWIGTGLFAHGEGKADRSADARHVTAGEGIEFAVPPELARTRSPTAVPKALAVTPLRVYSPTGEVTRGSVVVGYSSGTGPTLLGTRVARLAARSAPQVEELGKSVGVRVTGTVAYAGVRDQVIVYSVPATGGNAVVLCLAAPNGSIASPAPDCERVATTLEIAHSSTIGHPISLSQIAAYPHMLREQFASYENAAFGLRRRLKEAKYSGKESSLTAQLASLYGRAARALAPARLDPLVEPVQRLLCTGLTHALDGYRLLARAASIGNRRAWALGRSQVTGAEGIISAALRQVVAE